jgi:hypothetical protein
MLHMQPNALLITVLPNVDVQGFARELRERTGVREVRVGTYRPEQITKIEASAFIPARGAAVGDPQIEIFHGEAPRERK